MSTTGLSTPHTEAKPEPGRSGFRPAARVLAVALALLLVAWGAVALIGVVVRGSDQASATFDDVTRIDVDTAFEDVEIVGDSGASDVTVERDWSWSLFEPKIAATQREGQLLVTSSCSFSPGTGCRGHVKIVVPDDMTVTVSTSDGELVVSDISGDVTADTSDGDLRAQSLSGRIALTTSDGDIDATGLESPEVTTSASDGHTRLSFDEPPTSVTAESSDGDVEIAVPDDRSDYFVTTDTADGETSVSVPTDQRSERHIDVSTSDGSIRIDATS